MFATERGTLK